ncbi:MAG: hypothetical protein LBS18_04015 [Clostridiales bacterium]|jgi:hypothetical protein|nr:hypothetical protein [Clostridiales bacterium]
MAIDGIGPKIMLHKAVEIAKDVSAQQRRAEMLLSAAANEVKADTLRMNEQVTDVYKTERPQIQREREKRGRKRDAQPENETDMAGGGGDSLLPVGYDEAPEINAAYKRIDIRV